MHDIRYDAAHDEILVTNPFAHAILVFRGGADGEESPLRVIQGPRTRMKRPDRIAVDPVHNEIIIPNRESILVFPREAQGDVAPIREIRGPDTQLGGVTLAVDPVHNLIVVGNNRALLIFNRTDDGNVKPRAVITGPKTRIGGFDQIQVYPPKGWIITAHRGGGDEGERSGDFVGIWSINDNGDVAPRWVLGGPKSTLMRPRGVALNPPKKELIVADMRLNMVLTYYFPELF